MTKREELINRLEGIRMLPHPDIENMPIKDLELFVKIIESTRKARKKANLPDESQVYGNDCRGGCDV